MGVYVDTSTGLVLCEDEDNAEEARVSVKTPTPRSYEQWHLDLQDLLLEGLTNARDRSWLVSDIAPEEKIDQTVPYDLHGYEEVRNRDGISFSLSASLDAKRVPNCVDIEHTINRYKQEIDYNDVMPEVFEALLSLFYSVKNNPSQKSLKWLPLMVEYLCNGIMLQDPSGEIAMSDLLSAFRLLRSEKDCALTLLRLQTAFADLLADDISNLKKQIKQLRGKFYGMNRKNKKITHER
jgi:hypothetical protein